MPLTALGGTVGYKIIKKMKNYINKCVIKIIKIQKDFMVSHDYHPSLVKHSPKYNPKFLFIFFFKTQSFALHNLFCDKLYLTFLWSHKV